MGLPGINNVGKGLKGYRTQEVDLETNDERIEPGDEVVIDYEVYRTYIKNIARRFYKKLPKKNARWDKDEFESEAWLALVECANKYFNSEYGDSLKAFAYPYIIKRLSEFMATNMYSLKARYYNVRNDPEKFERINWLERTIWSESQHGGTNSDDEDNPILSKPSGITSIMDEAADEEEKQIIKDIVNVDLPTQERRAIVRRFRDGETYREIGDRLNVSAETARKLVIRGLKLIKEKAENAGISSNQNV